MALPVVIVSVSSDARKFQAKLDDLGKRQWPFAAAQALTATARQAGAELMAAMPGMFDRPTPFTLHGVGIKAARKGELSAEIFLKPIQARYLAPSIEGTRQYTPKEDILNPKNAALNSYGNLPRRALAQLKKRKDVFVGTVHGVYGVWQRPKRRSGALKLLIRLDSGITLRKRFDFAGIVRASVEQTIAPNLEKAMAQAIATAH